ncbi:hypothetical protein O0I10_010451 [Lichtheimia ornata]|uniref:Galactose oxidase n=1 Tax=Lichtheimia ornata TaxID=688661 RepID=A0AAD7XRB1_9FUNG|nr:uncharacterized protein O0I10_010451 [Lichtheimia ornata]KAJ8653884.1 hypothetical protein O0I10_010451 [Lichtheimia ornata]
MVQVTSNHSASAPAPSESPTLPPDGRGGEDSIHDLQLPMAQYNGIARSKARAPPPPLGYNPSKTSALNLPTSPRNLPLSPSSSFTTNSPPTSSFATVTSTPATSVDTAHHGSTLPTLNQDHHHHHHHHHQQQQQQQQHEHQSPSSFNVRKKKHSTAKSTNGTTSKCVVADHVAAALELTRTNPQVPPAPAAGMYWSRAVTFSARSKDAPALRAHSSCVVQDHLYVFGGSDAKRCFNTLHVLDMETMTWSKPSVSGKPPPPSRAHSMTLVERRLDGRMQRDLYVFGGGDGPHYFNDVYKFDIGTSYWSKVETVGKPPIPRRAHTASLWGNKLVIFGGGDGGHALNDVHTLDLAQDPPQWKQLDPTGTRPPQRGYHTTTLVKDKLVVYGGSDGKTCFGDVYILDLVGNVWSQVDVLDRIIPRLAHAALQVGSYVFVIGGHDGSRYSNQVLMLNLVSMAWETRTVYGSPIVARGYHTAVLHDSRIYVLGGYDGKDVFDDVHILELSACAYLPQITNFDI